MRGLGLGLGLGFSTRRSVVITGDGETAGDVNWNEADWNWSEADWSWAS